MYCQLIQDANKEKRLSWALRHKDEAAEGGFEDVVWTDECSVQLETHRWFCCKKQEERPRNKPQYSKTTNYLYMHVYMYSLYYTVLSIIHYFQAQTHSEGPCLG